MPRRKISEAERIAAQRADIHKKYRLEARQGGVEEWRVFLVIDVEYLHMDIPLAYGLASESLATSYAARLGNNMVDAMLNAQYEEKIKVRGGEKKE